MNMGYKINCINKSCQKESKAINIDDLVKNCKDSFGKLKCRICGNSGAYIFRESKLQEKNEKWKRYIKGIITIETEDEDYTPYVFLTSQVMGGEIDGIHFGYYKDLRKKGGKLKHGHGPGGSPVFSKDEIFQLLGKLIHLGVVSKQDFIDFIEKVKE